MANKFDLIWF